MRESQIRARRRVRRVQAMAQGDGKMNSRLYSIPGSELCPVMFRTVNLSELKLPLSADAVTARCMLAGAKALENRVSQADRKRARAVDAPDAPSPAPKRAASSLSLASLQTASSDHGAGLADLLHFGETAR
jgi:hypothetical protein